MVIGHALLCAAYSVSIVNLPLSTVLLSRIVPSYSLSRYDSCDGCLSFGALFDGIIPPLRKCVFMVVHITF